MHKCHTPCVFYYEIYNKELEIPSVKVVCDYHEDEIKNIPIEKINNCQHFKTIKQLKENFKKIFQINS